MADAPAPPSAIRNIGPKMEAAFRHAGIETAAEIRRIGADAAYARLLASGHRAHFMAYAALALGLMDRPWNDLAAEEKPALRARFDALKTPARDRATSREEIPPALAAEMRRLGLGR